MAGPINGQLGAFEQPGQWGRNDTGNFSVRVFEGSRAEVTALAESLAETLGLTYEVSESFGKFRLDVHFPWNWTANNASTDLVIRWELFANHCDKDLLEAQVEVPSVIGLLTQNQIQYIRHYLESPVTTPKTMPIPGGTASVDVITPLTKDYFADGTDDGTNALKVYNLMVQGVRSHPIDQPILKRTMTTSQNYAVAMALTNVRKIISTTSLVSLESVDTDSLFYNPANGQLLLPQDISSNPNLAYGWYKTFPTIQQIALQKWQIVQEWQYGLWATLTWGTPL